MVVLTFNYRSRVTRGRAALSRSYVVCAPDFGPPKWRMARRHFVAALALLGFANIYAMRANLSVAIVEMSTGTYRNINGTRVHIDGEFPLWSSMTQGVILGSFFYGYILTQLPGGILAHRHGGKNLFVIGVFGTAVFTLLTPPLAKVGYGALAFARFVEGLFEGVTYPAMHVMWSHWAPILEKTKLATFAFSGSYFGTVIAMPLSAVIGQALGWPFIFYFFGLLAVLWCFVWIRKVSDYPTTDPQITTDELTLLQRDAVGHSHYIVPWAEMLKSKPVWAVVVAHFCQNWGFYTMLTNLPRILKELANYELEKAGFVSGLPYLMMGCTLVWGGQLADYLRKECNIDTLIVRRRFCAAGFAGQALFLALASVTSSPPLLVAYLTVSIGLGGICWAGFSVNHLDLAPQFAGHLMGISNTLATLPGMLCPLIVGYVVTSGTTLEWNIVFYSTAVVYGFGGAFFWKYASGELQLWAGEQAPFVGELH
ncbi:unnamed protein product [Angiostrongylus costaricensis]|uniref:Sialin n=1 Tax=Angiostrongylus costaricensis TaxID=334426 RepID=A0A0R3PLG9_ANGCS|nr:unnamed protein product [Angiostrongylus costaricensis]